MASIKLELPRIQANTKGFKVVWLVVKFTIVLTIYLAAVAAHSGWKQATILIGSWQFHDHQVATQTLWGKKRQSKSVSAGSHTKDAVLIWYSCWSQLYWHHAFSKCLIKFWTTSRFILKQLDYSLSLSMRDSWLVLRPRRLSCDRNLELII